jgi:phosphoribosylanthranilate isomerase
MWVKICGLTSPEALSAALAAGADAAGFVFAPSVRALEPSSAERLAAPARGRCEVIAVTLHPSQALVDQIVREFRPDTLQSDLEDFDQLRLPETLARLPVLRSGAAWCGRPPRRLLFEGTRSGQGLTADWEHAARLARESHLILAGGLSSTNVVAAIEAVRPFGVDVSSAVESAPGRKSPEKIHEFIRAVRTAEQRHHDADA